MILEMISVNTVKEARDLYWKLLLELSEEEAACEGEKDSSPTSKMIINHLIMGRHILIMQSMLRR